MFISANSTSCQPVSLDGQSFNHSAIQEPSGEAPPFYIPKDACSDYLNIHTFKDAGAVLKEYQAFTKALEADVELLNVQLEQIEVGCVDLSLNQYIKVLKHVPTFLTLTKNYSQIVAHQSQLVIFHSLVSDLKLIAETRYDFMEQWTEEIEAAEREFEALEEKVRFCGVSDKQNAVPLFYQKMIDLIAMQQQLSDSICEINDCLAQKEFQAQQHLPLRNCIYSVIIELAWGIFHPIRTLLPTSEDNIAHISTKLERLYVQLTIDFQTDLQKLIILNDSLLDTLKPYLKRSLKYRIMPNRAIPINGLDALSDEMKARKKFHAKNICHLQQISSNSSSWNCRLWGLFFLSLELSGALCGLFKTANREHSVRRLSISEMKDEESLHFNVNPTLKNVTRIQLATHEFPKSQSIYQFSVALVNLNDLLDDEISAECNLRQAVLDKNVSGIASLISSGVDIDAQNGLDRTALHIASKYDYVEIMTQLIKAGAANDIMDTHSYTPQNYCRLHRQKSECKKILGKDPYTDKVEAIKVLGHSWEINGTNLINDMWVSLESWYPGAAAQVFNEQLAAFAKEFPSTFNQTEVTELRSTLQRSLRQDANIIMKDIQHGIPTVVYGGYETHSVIVLVVDNYLVICNKGAVSQRPIEIYRVDSNRITKEQIEEIINISKRGDIEDYEEWLENVPFSFDIKEDELTHFLNDAYPFRKKQVVGNCSWESLETSLYILLALKRLESNTQLDFDRQKFLQKLASDFEEFLQFTALHSAENYFKELSGAIDLKTLQKIDKLSSRIQWKSSLSHKVAVSLSKIRSHINKV